MTPRSYADADLNAYLDGEMTGKLLIPAERTAHVRVSDGQKKSRQRRRVVGHESVPSGSVCVTRIASSS